MGKRSTIVLTVLLVVLTTAPGAFSALIKPSAQSHGVVGLKAGMIGRADFDSDEEHSQTTIGASFGAFFSFPVGTKFFIGPAFDVHNMLVLGKQEFMLDL